MELVDVLSSSDWLSGHLNLSIREGRDNDPKDPQATSVCSQTYEPTLSSDPIGLTSILSVQLFFPPDLTPVSCFVSFCTVFCSVILYSYSVLSSRTVVGSQALMLSVLF